jgi:hypothetical protein
VILRLFLNLVCFIIGEILRFDNMKKLPIWFVVVLILTGWAIGMRLPAFLEWLQKIIQN